MPLEFFSPVSNITPFTYRDGETYLQQLKRLKIWIDEVAEMSNLNDQNIIDQFDAGMATAIAATAAAEAAATAAHNSATNAENLAGMMVDVQDAGLAFLLEFNGLSKAVLDAAKVGPAGKTTTGAVEDLNYINVKDFGAAGTGLADDTASMQAAINAAGILGIATYIPTGTYAISASLVLPSNTTIYGDGWSSEVKQITPSIFSALWADGSDNISVSDIWINGNRSGRQEGLVESLGDGDSQGMWFRAPDNAPAKGLSVRRCKISDISNIGLMVFNYHDAYISNNYIYDTRRDGIDVWFNSQDVMLTDNVVELCGDDCISILGEHTEHVGAKVKNVTITGGVYSQRTDTPYGRGILVQGADNVTINGAVVHDTHGHGIMVDKSYVNSYSSSRVTISNCIVDKAADSTSNHSGISVTQGNDITISNCVVNNGYNTGILIGANAPKVMLQGNTITGGGTGNNNSEGITLLSSNNTVRGNRFRGIPSYPLRVTGQGNLIEGNYFIDCCLAGGTNLRVEGGIGNHIVNNVVNKGSGLSSWGIRLVGASTGNTVMNNRAHGYTVGAGVTFSDASTGNNDVQPDLEMHTKVVNYAITNVDRCVVAAAGTAITLTLPVASNVPLGRRILIKNRSATASVTVDSAGGTIDGGATSTLTTGQAATFLSDNVNWHRC